MNIKSILMKRDGLTTVQADQLIEEAKKQLCIYLENKEYWLADAVCEEYFGLEMDYLIELVDSILPKIKVTCLK